MGRKTVRAERSGRLARSSAGRTIRAGGVSPAISFHGALPATATFTSPRAWAYVLLGIEEYLRAFRVTARSKVA